MTRDELRRLCDAGLTVSFSDSARALGIGLTAARSAYARGDYPLRVVRCGRALRVPCADVAALLLAPDMSEAGVRSPAVATTANASGVRHADFTVPLRSA